MGIANVELRFPLINQLVFGSSVGFPPIEGFIFADAGVAWTRSTSLTFTRGIPENPNERGFMTSAGIGMRVNVFGLLVLEIDRVHAFEREQPWHWQFNFVPGF